MEVTPASPEISQAQNLLNSAVDKEFNSRIIAEARTRPGRFVPTSEVSNNVLRLFSSNDPDAMQAACSVVGNRGMNLAEFSTLAAVVNPDFKVQDIQNGEPLLTGEQIQSMDRLLGKGLAFTPDMVRQLQLEASKVGMGIGEMMKRYGTVKAQDIALNTEGGMDALQRRTQADLSGDQQPGLKRIKDEFVSRMQIRMDDSKRQSDARIKALEVEAARVGEKTEPQIPKWLAEDRPKDNRVVEQVIGTETSASGKTQETTDSETVQPSESSDFQAEMARVREEYERKIRQNNEDTQAEIAGIRAEMAAKAEQRAAQPPDVKTYIAEQKMGGIRVMAKSMGIDFDSLKPEEQQRIAGLDTNSIFREFSQIYHERAMADAADDILATRDRLTAIAQQRAELEGNRTF